MIDDNSEAILEEVTKNWEQFLNLIKKYVEDEEVKEGLLSLCDDLNERILTCPASTRRDYVAAYPGGLVKHSLNVCKKMVDLNKIYKTQLASDSLIVTGLFHDIGKIGNKEAEYYLPQKSDWHKNKGILFEINPDISNASVAARSVYWLNAYKTPLSIDELQAILSLQHMNQIYTAELYVSPPLTMLLQQAVRAAITLKK